MADLTLQVNNIKGNLKKYELEAKRKLLKVLEIEGKKSINKNFEEGGRPDKWKKKYIDDERAILTGPKGNLQTRTVAIADFAASRVKIGNKLVYGRIQNEGGRIIKTAKMTKFFWAMYYAAGGGKKGEEDTGDSVKWKSMALKKGGIDIPKREYLRIPTEDHPRILRNCERVLKTINIT